MQNNNLKSKKRTTLFLMILGNIVILIGVFFFKWQPFLIIFLYWFENIIVGFYNILKMIISQAPNEDQNSPLQEATVNPIALKFFLIPFFLIHYGMFTLVHGVFIFAFFARSKEFYNPLYLLFDSKLYAPIITLFITHGVLFILKFIKNNDYKKISLQRLMFYPYKRIVILHLTIIASAFFVLMLKGRIIGSVILVAFKIIAEVTNAFTIKDFSTAIDTSQVNNQNKNDEDIVFTFDDPGDSDDLYNDD